jgi:uncharacterized protein (TIGR00255 family)
MTGFGRAKAEREWGAVTIELSSVNHRYQDITVRAPRELSSLEPWFHQKLRGMFRRGKLQMRAEVTWAASSLASSFNREVLLNYYREISSIRDELGAERDISLDALINLPEVLDSSGHGRFKEDGGDLEMLETLLCDAVSNWNAMRKTEGIHLREAVESHTTDLERCVKEIELAWPGERDAAFETMKERVNKALEASGASMDESRIASEAIMIADKWDISEELARMASHIAKFREIGETRESEGRKLDFIVQEMNREANTINSKSASSRIRWITVEAKSAIERIREQIQNLE